MKLIGQVADRALIVLEGWDKMTICMDLWLCIEGGCDLDLEGMTTCRLPDLIHDIWGINLNLDRQTGKLENCFSPRMRRRNKKISSVKAYSTNATIFLEDDTFRDLNYDFQDRHFFESQEEAEKWLKEEVTESGIEYDADKLESVILILVHMYCSK